jgi:predicted dehydrogenase
MKYPTHTSARTRSRRAFLQATASASVGLGIARGAHAAGDETIRFALVGCGARGTSAAAQALSTKGPVKLVAMADVFGDRLERCLKFLSEGGVIRSPDAAPVGERIDVPPERRFVGFDAYGKAIQSGVDLVLLATPPVFRPAHYQAAVEAGKHVFMEKPCAVDAPGVRTVMAANEIARQKGLAVGVGFQRRHQNSYLELVKKIHDGGIGKVTLVRTYFNMTGSIDGPKPLPNVAQMEHQLRNYPWFAWLSGDYFCDQSVHAIDVANWVMRSYPVKANGMGGRQVRVGPWSGDILDHGFVEFQYADGARFYAQTRQIPGAWEYIGEHVAGDRGEMTLGVGLYGGIEQRGYQGNNPYQQEQDDLIAGIRAGKPAFEGDYGARSSMSAILGRMALYSGQEVAWEDAIKSEVNLLPQKLALDAAPPVLPDPGGHYHPVPAPGVTKPF